MADDVETVRVSEALQVERLLTRALDHTETATEVEPADVGDGLAEPDQLLRRPGPDLGIANTAADVGVQPDEPDARGGGRIEVLNCRQASIHGCTIPAAGPALTVTDSRCTVTNSSFIGSHSIATVTLGSGTERTWVGTMSLVASKK